MKTFKIFINEEVNKEGYHKNLVVYHGTGHHFDSFKDNSKRNEGTPEREISGHYFTSNPMTAASYAQSVAKKTGNKPNIIKANLHMDNPKNVTNEIKKHQKSGMTFSDAKHKAYSGVDRTKHDGVYHNGSAVNHSEYVAFHSHQIKRID